MPICKIFFRTYLIIPLGTLPLFLIFKPVSHDVKELLETISLVSECKQGEVNDLTSSGQMSVERLNICPVPVFGCKSTKSLENSYALNFTLVIS